VTEDRHDEEVIQAWNEHRPYLIDLAFRMLGDIGAAEDVVQDAFARLLRAPRGEIEDDRGWLIVVTSRLCLDQIRSARSRRERPHDASEIEYVPGTQPPVGPQPATDPADRITLDDDVQLALLVVLQRLGPAERVVFVLHDIFGVPFDSIAQTLGRPAATCRQLARRARQKIQDSPGDTVEIGVVEHRQVTEKFIAACASGDLDGLLQVLAPDVWGDFDPGPGGQAIGVIRGADRVARNLLHYWGPGATLVTHPVAGQPALLGFTGRELTGVLVFTMAGSKIQAIHVIGDPRKLSAIGSQLA
jgi:RNA polymerase sigma-70 factor, ECF subfamily